MKIQKNIFEKQLKQKKFLNEFQSEWVYTIRFYILRMQTDTRKERRRQN